MDNQIQNQIFQAMENPLFYPHRVSGVRQVQTHISKVFLTGEYVYKIKKAVDFGFLNFSSLENRRYYCCREIVLNRRLSNDIYLDLVVVTIQNGILALGGTGRPVEYAVRMRQLKNSMSLDHLISTGDVSCVDMVALGRRLSDFYLKTPQSQLLHVKEGWETVHDNCLENFKKTEVSCGTILNRDIWETVKGATLSFLKHHKSYFDMRVKKGKIRDCHGDLRCDHIYFTETGIQIIDCIEFNDFFRHIDVICDLAFFLMDLESKQEYRLGRAVLNQYLRQTGDLRSMLMFPFYKCYRAMVRCKVNCLFHKETGLGLQRRRMLRLDAFKYLDMAYQYALQFFRPRIWVVCGMPASGKSTLAKQLAQIFCCEVFRSDVVRKQLFGLSPHESGIDLFGEKMYSSLAGSFTYGKMLCLAQEKIDRGKSVILDATYSRDRYRNDLLLLAREKGIKPVFIECHAEEQILRQRLLNRESVSSVSDARIDHFKRLTARYERFRYAGNALHIRINTAVSVERSLRHILVQAFCLDTDPMIDISMPKETSEVAMA